MSKKKSKSKSKSGKELQKSSLEQSSSSSSSVVSSSTSSSSTVVDSSKVVSSEADEAEDNRNLLKRIFEKISHNPNDWANCTAIRIELVARDPKNHKFKEGGGGSAKQTKAVSSVKVSPNKSTEYPKATALVKLTGSEEKEASAKKKTTQADDSPRKGKEKVRKEEKESKQSTEQ